ncbi:hypothetical protein M0R45_020830 [Rubus argutus]|uniref:Uncharacterized protein n=1 Tax=Rubus argutus TaxID=59490 RepID=A0AAW1XCP3_RUBAR
MAATTVAPQPSTTTPSKFNPKTVRKAVNALLKWQSSKLQTQNPNLLRLGRIHLPHPHPEENPPKGSRQRLQNPSPKSHSLRIYRLLFDIRRHGQVQAHQGPSLQAQIRLQGVRGQEEANGFI